MTNVDAVRDHVMREVRWSSRFGMSEMVVEELAVQILFIAQDLVPQPQRRDSFLQSLSTTPGDAAVRTHLSPMLAPGDWLDDADADPRLVENVRRLLSEHVDKLCDGHAVACHIQRAEAADTEDAGRSILRAVIDGEADGLSSPSPAHLTEVLFGVAEAAIGLEQPDLAWQVLQRAIDHDSHMVLASTRRALALAGELPTWQVYSGELAMLALERDTIVVVRPGRAADALDQYLAACDLADAVRGLGLRATPLCLWHGLIYPLTMSGLSAPDQSDNDPWRPGVGISLDTSLLGDPPLGRTYGPLRPLRHSDTDVLLAKAMLLGPRPREAVTLEAFPQSHPGDSEIFLVRGTDHDLGSDRGWTATRSS